MKNFILISAAFLFLSFPTAFRGQATETKIIELPKGCITQTGNVLERRNCDIEWKDELFPNAVTDIFWFTWIPSGISVAFENSLGDEIKINYKPSDFTVKSLLDEIVKFDKRYRWQETDGVINVFPQNDYPILDARVAEFKVEKATPKQLREKLVGTTEFQNYLKAKNLADRIPGDESRRGWMYITVAGALAERHKVSLDLKNATVREILNAIVRQRGYSIWTYREYNLISDGKTHRLYNLEL